MKIFKSWHVCHISQICTLSSKVLKMYGTGTSNPFMYFLYYGFKLEHETLLRDKILCIIYLKFYRDCQIDEHIS